MATLLTLLLMGISSERLLIQMKQLVIEGTYMKKYNAHIRTLLYGTCTIKLQ